MSALLRRIALAAAAFALAFAAHATSVVPEWDEVPDAATRIERINIDIRAIFDAEVRDHDARIEQQPFDVWLQMQRCRFIDDFASMYEYASFIDEIYERGEQCHELLARKYPEHPEVSLQQLQRTYGEQQLKDGDELLRKTHRQNWTNGQLARLYAMLAKTAEALGRANAADYASRALELDEASDVRIIVATRMIQRGEHQQAIETLTSPADRGNPKDGWSLIKKVGLLTQAGAHEQAVLLYSKLEDTSTYSHIEAARALRAAGAVALARKELGLAVQQGNYTDEDEKERFRFELELGTPREALAAYVAWRDLGWESDPLAINRYALMTRDALLPWQARDLLGVLAFVATVAVLGLALLLPLSFVHYRGLALRARTGDAYPSDGWQLRHAWAALFAFGVASLLSLYAAGPLDVIMNDVTGWGVDATPRQLARITFAESFWAIALLLPLARLATTRQRSWWGIRWSIGKSLLVGAAVGLAFRIPLLLTALARPDAAPLLAPNDPVWQLMLQVREQFGLVVALWMLSIAAPVVEEFIFRGVLLKSFTSHIGFGWANALQAVLFSAMHFDLKAAPMLFLVGATLGWMTRRSGGLLAPMIMHAVFNLLAGMFFL